MADGRSPGTPRRRGRPPRTDEQRAEQRRRLIEGAMKGLRRHGPDASIDLLATGAGVSKPVFYDEFGDKLGIADAIAVELAGQLEQRVISEVAADGGDVDFDVVMRAVVDALVDVIEREPEIYSFVVRSIRSSDRGFLDNALVQVVRDRAAMLVGMFAPGIPESHLLVLTDALFGFVFAAVESWQETRSPPKDELVDMLTAVIRHGFRGVSTSTST